MGLGMGPFPDSAVVTWEKVRRAERSFCGGLKESTCGTGTLGHNRSRRVLFSPNADCGMIGEEKAKCQAARNCGKISGCCIEAMEVGHASKVLHVREKCVRYVLQTLTA